MLTQPKRNSDAISFGGKVKVGMSGAGVIISEDIAAAILYAVTQPPRVNVNLSHSPG